MSTSDLARSTALCTHFEAGLIVGWRCDSTE